MAEDVLPLEGLGEGSEDVAAAAWGLFVTAGNVVENEIEGGMEVLTVTVEEGAAVRLAGAAGFNSLGIYA